MDNLLSLLPAFILALFAAVILVLYLIRPKFRYFWMLAVGGSFLAWLSVWFLRFRLPTSSDILFWQPAGLFPVSPALLLDRISWPYALALSTLALAAILTDISRSTETHRGNWTGSLAFTALGILAALAGNPLSLMLTWTALDLIELIILIVRVRQNELRPQIFATYAARVAGIFALMAATGVGGELPASFAQISPQNSIFLLLAAGLRLGVFPLHLPFLQQATIERGFSTLLTLVPAGTSLMLLTRVATVITPEPLMTILLLLTGLAVLYASGSWAVATDDLDGRPFWILSFAALAITATLRGEQGASLAFGITGLLSGGLLFLYSTRPRNLLFLPLIGLAWASMLPLTPSWQGVRLYTPPMPLTLLLYLPAQALLLIGYLRHALQPGEPPRRAERWIWLFYPLGLLLIPLTHLIIAWFGNPASRVETDLPRILDSWPGILVLLFAAGIYLAYQRGWRAPAGVIQFIRRSLSLNWFYALFWKIYRWLGRSLEFVSQILEGEGGILWALLILIVILTLLTQETLGG
ncbi:MAG TPA: hypothetical protein VN363_06220 [Anaerolineales bacterium]|nr:hypothetical protein [Anaerolineales bacterium]